ncbi:uncharacterized protein LOC110705278 [Chenopodium quinoa]|uniref:uncharacterized protein LOC110705278 n=1 Tax=Chenopodium quinoa TaxID=63459 RepID=UPI000B78DA61|nr:uncharacterized protein LOC110705278 [Chenopodium quinoa]
MLANQLANVGAKVSEHRLVITLVRGLPKAYGNVAALLQQSDPPVPFQKARSMLLLEESRQANQATNEANASGSALLVAGNSSPNHEFHSTPANHGNRNQQKQYNGGRGGSRGGNNNKGRNNGGRNNKGRGGRGSGQQPQRQQPPQWNDTQGWQFPPWAAWGPTPWAVPPCPYPTSQWARPPAGPRIHQLGILGPRPQQHQQSAFSSQTPSSVGYAPTDVEAALHTLSLTPPDENWYMDTGATSHMTSQQGTLSSYFNLSNNRNIIVGNGSGIPIRGFGQTSLPPFTLKNVLHAPNLIKNLISVRKFTCDNLVSIEFDLFGFSVKDLDE